MQALMMAIVTWLSVNFGLAGTVDLPRVQRVSPERMVEVRLRAHGAGEAMRSTAAWRREAVAGAVDLEALYDDASRTIFLREDWTGTTPAEVSVLVHEMVHHLQNVGGLRYECAEARERLAYLAQGRWLAVSGRSLSKEFKLDPATLLVRTKCFY